MTRNILIAGASSGLGARLAELLPVEGDKLWSISRNKPKPSVLMPPERWIEADLSIPSSIGAIAKRLMDVPLNMIVYATGTWESSPDLAEVTAEELYRVLAVNTAGFIALVVALEQQLRLAQRAIVVAIGSTAGHENATGPRAAYAASKFGLRGACYALRERYRSIGVPVTCISPGGLEDNDRASPPDSAERIPATDIFALIQALYGLSPASCPKEIVMPAMREGA